MFSGAFDKSFFGTFGRWQDKRPIWLIGGLAALFLDCFSVAYFQHYLNLQPCEMCVYIRFSILTIFVGAMVAATWPRWVITKLLGYVIVIWAIVRGGLWSWNLSTIYAKAALVRAGADPFSVGMVPCKMFPTFPFDLKLDEWLPQFFAPLGPCGEVDWQLFGLNMAQWMLIVYACFALIVLFMLIGWMVRMFSR